MDFTAHRRRLSPTSLRASAYLIGELLCPPANRRTPLTTHERRDGHPIGRHRNADRQCETARDVRRRDHVLADDELAALPLDPGSAPFARPRGQVLRAKAEISLDLDSRSDRCIEYPDRVSNLRHPDREVIRPNTARRDQVCRASRTDLGVDDATGRRYGS